MANKYPYTLSKSHIIQIVDQLRKSFPATVTTDTIKKLGIAPNNESYIINTLKFLGVIDDEGNKSKLAGSIFSKHEDTEFNQEFSKLVRSAYSELFDLYQDQSWTLDQGKLISFFRESAQSTDSVGRHQANTFQALATLSGYGEPPKVERTRAPKPRSNKSPQPSVSAELKSKQTIGVEKKAPELGLTVRIEINLPAVADQEKYDMIFKSIRKYLLND
jgi:hypothetical protein